MDALSELMRGLRLSGGLFLNAELTAPWALTSQVDLGDIASGIDSDARIISLHYVLSGSLYLQVGAGEPIALKAGTIVLLPRNDLHVLASQPGLKAASSLDLIETPVDGGPMRIRYGGAGDLTRVICGFVGAEVRGHPLLEVLPDTLVLDLHGQPSDNWVAASFRHAASQFGVPRDGGDIAFGKLTELLFIEAVRHFVDGAGDARQGLLAGLRDPAVARALALVHGNVAHPWTAEELASRVHLSRSTFAERFNSVMEMPPMSYLTRWRMQVAADRLTSTRRSVAQIAAEVGYESEAAFARAFKRERGRTPAAARRG